MAFPKSKIKMLQATTAIALIAFVSPCLCKTNAAKPQMGQSYFELVLLIFLIERPFVI
jgi:hypothetical protein